MSDSSIPTKPKRVLTEAQRLAFLKGREKRMANIMKKREEKLEAEQMEIVEHPSTPDAEPEPDVKDTKEIQEPPKKKRKAPTKKEVVPNSPTKSEPAIIPNEPDIDMSTLHPIMTVEDRDMLLDKFKILEEMTSKLLAMQDGKSSNKENVPPPLSPPVLKRTRVRRTESSPGNVRPIPKRPISSLQNVFNWA